MTTSSRRRFLLCTAGFGSGLALGLEGLANQLADAPPFPAGEGDLITPAAEQAAERGLAFLAARQRPDGSYGEQGAYQGNVAVASLAGLAFMAGGHHPGRGRYGPAVARALEYVLGRESANPQGYLHEPSSQRQSWMYSHGFGTLFLAEAYGMVPDRELQKRLRGTLERAVRFIVTAQNGEGGWRYEPKARVADVSVTICQIMALRAARNVGVFVPKSTVDACVRYVRACQNPDGGFNYFRGQAGASAFARTAAGVVALYNAGVYDDPAIERGLNYLMRYKPGPGRARFDIPHLHYYYGHYYAAQAMWTAGGRWWAEWFPAVRDELLEKARFAHGGAWNDDSFQIGPEYSTAMACIILQIPYNYLPILQK